MRRLRRRRPAGEPQVPIEVVEPSVLAPVVGPTVVRIGPDRTLLDAPWEMFGCTVANVWPDERVAGGWARVEWPCDRWSGRPIAPLDLQLGHVLEVSIVNTDRRVVRYAIVAIVAIVDQNRVVLAGTASAVEAATLARRAVDVWHSRELLLAEQAWIQRIRRARASGYARRHRTVR